MALHCLTIYKRTYDDTFVEGPINFCLQVETNHLLLIETKSIKTFDSRFFINPSW